MDKFRCDGHPLLFRWQPVGLTLAFASGRECNGRGERQHERHPHGAGLQYRARGEGSEVGNRLQRQQSCAGAGGSSGSTLTAGTSTSTMAMGGRGYCAARRGLPHRTWEKDTMLQEARGRSTGLCAGGG
jgi:hypothetical protein